MKITKKMPCFFGVIFAPFLTPFWRGLKNGQKWPQKPKNSHFFAKKRIFGKNASFFPPGKSRFLRFRIPPRPHFWGQNPKKGGFWPIFRPFLA